MPERPLKDKYIGFRIPAAKKKALEENAAKYAEALAELQDIDDLAPAKIARRLVDAFNRAMAGGELPVYPFKLVTMPKSETPQPEPKQPKQKRSPKSK